MLKIKLARFGKKNQPHYRMIVNEARSKRDGGYVAKLGHYAPTQEPKILEVDVKEYHRWIAQGAQPTPTVANLVKRFESGNPFPAKKARPSKKTLAKANKKAEEVEVVAPVEAAVAEAPVEEVVAAKSAEPTVEAVVEPVKTEEKQVTKE
jgi:small subunit ribosomal protein S16